MSNKNENTGLTNVWIELLAKIIVSFFPLFIFGMSENSVMFGMVWMQTSNVLIQSMTDFLKQTFQRFRTTNDAILHISEDNSNYVYLSWFVCHEIQSNKPRFSLHDKEVRILTCEDTISFEWNGIIIKIYGEIQKENKRSLSSLVVSSKYLPDINSFIVDCESRYETWLELTRSKTKTQEMWLFNKYDNAWDIKKIRNSKSVENYFIDQDVKDFLLNDVKSFVENEETYKSLSIPYKRGYLLTGPPGCGKTTFQYVVSNMLKWDVVKISATNLTNRTFQRLINKTLPYSIVTVDDVDRLPSFTNKEETYNLREKEEIDSIDGEEVKLKDNDPVHLKTMLEIFDGYEYLHGCILILTCNDASKLNPTLMRSGRIDVKQEISLPSLKCVCSMLKTVYGKKCEGLVDEWQSFVISKNPDLEKNVGICMAEILNNYVIKNKSNIERTFKQLSQTLLKE